MKKRVYTLYRVSTIGQVEKDDIPMQKEACHEFAERQGWEIVKEFSEKGVSGFKKSAKDRDQLQLLQQAAAAGEFDVLLVFMFDRLGRRDDETPFIVEWFTKQGVEVWSVNEGQQRFDSHVDKLMNYIRYWQASGESIKTSIRTRTRIEQLTEEGHYTGGTVAFGYKRVKKGRVNKKNQEVCELEINEEEAEIVRLIFQKYVYALAGDAHHQRTGGGRRCPDSCAGAIPVCKRSGTAFADRPKGPAADQPETENRGYSADHDRQPHQLRKADQQPDPAGIRKEPEGV